MMKILLAICSRGAHSGSAVPHGAVLTGLALLCLLGGTSAQAMSLRELRTLEKTEKQGRRYTDYYLVGVMEGVLEAHHHAVRQGAKPTI